MSHSSRPITLRGIPMDIYREMLQEAKQKGLSLNKVLLNKILPKRDKKEGGAASLLSLAGTWDASRANDFEKQIEDHRRIDEELWA